MDQRLSLWGLPSLSFGSSSSSSSSCFPPHVVLAQDLREKKKEKEKEKEEEREKDGIEEAVKCLRNLGNSLKKEKVFCFSFEILDQKEGKLKETESLRNLVENLSSSFSLSSSLDPRIVMTYEEKESLPSPSLSSFSLSRIHLVDTTGDIGNWHSVAVLDLERGLVYRTANFVGGEWRSNPGVFWGAGNAGCLDVVDPATATLFNRVPLATEEDVNDAVKAAKSSFHDWSHLSGKARAHFLEKIALEIEKDKEYLIDLEVLDNGKPRSEAEGDLSDTIDCFRYYSRAAARLDSQQNAPVDCETSDFDVTIRKEPVGVAALIIPWNYPLLMAAWKVAPCLAAGAVCILKASEESPITALELVAISNRVALPSGVFNLLSGAGQTGGALSTHPGIDKVAFTGSRETGVRVSKAASDSLKTVSLELGGKSPALVFDDVDIDFVVEWLMVGIFFNQGQVCSATSRLIVQESVKDRLLLSLCERAKGLKMGAGYDLSSKLGPLIAKRQQIRVESYIEKGKKSGAKTILEVTKENLPQENQNGFFVGPTIFDLDPLPSLSPLSIWEEEIFGPVLCVKSFKDEKEAIEMANDSIFGLAAAVFSKDEERCKRVVRELEAGCCWINCSQPNFVHAPWGGFKQSGTGRELGPWGLDNYLEVKQVCRCLNSFTWGIYVPGQKE